MDFLGKIGVGPMSENVIEAVFRFSAENNGEPMMLIASKNQIDWNGGYVGNWTTGQYRNFLDKLRVKYPGAKVRICRDHCGPGFKNGDLKDVYKTIDNDIENGFDLIHVDFSHLKGDKNRILEESKKAIDYIRRKNSEIFIEIGTDENTGSFSEDIPAIEKEMEFFTGIAPIYFFVCQTGSLVKEIGQAGKFNREFIKKVRLAADKYKIRLKEHNADYIDAAEINKRSGLIDALNIAPQYGVMQTQLTLEKCREFGIDASDFLDEAYKSGKWKKWLYKNTAENKKLCSIIAGHYVFSSSVYKKLYDKINKHEDFQEAIYRKLAENFKMYIKEL